MLYGPNDFNHHNTDINESNKKTIDPNPFISIMATLSVADIRRTIKKGRLIYAPIFVIPYL
jgi:hypothetical protein